MKILIAGLGSIGRRHLRNLLTLGIKKEEIILLRSGRSTLPDNELNGYTTESDIYEALDIHRPEAVVVSNPTSLHMDIAIPAAKAGAHLFLEKPISHNLEKVKELTRQVKANKVIVMVGFQFRFHPGLRFVKKLIESGIVGKVVYAESHWGEYLPDWHPWEDYRKSYAARKELGGGVILTLCHPFDYLHWLIGDVNEVIAFSKTLGNLDIKVEDTADINLQFSIDALGHVHLNYLEKPHSHWVKIIGTNGIIKWDYKDGAVKYFNRTNNKWNYWNYYIPPSGFERNWMFFEEMKHFLSCIRENKKPSVSLEDGIAALKLAIAAKKSSQEGRRITLDEIK